jgi:hypothetical protein
VNEFTLVLVGAWFLQLRKILVPKRTCQKELAKKNLPKRTCRKEPAEKNLESFEAGKGLWHARIRRADQEPVVIDGVLFSTLEVGFAWSSPDAAVADAKTQIDHLNQRCAALGQMTQTELPAAS